MGKIDEWLVAQRDRKKLKSQPFEEGVAELREYLNGFTLSDIEVGVDPSPDPKRWVLEMSGSQWEILNQTTGARLKGDLSKQADELLSRIHNFDVREASSGYFAGSLPFENTITAPDPTGNDVRFYCQLPRQFHDDFFARALLVRKLWNKLRPVETDEPTEEP